MYASWDMEYNRYNFFVDLGHFLLFYHPKKQESQNFEKTIKIPGDITILHLCTTNDDHMMYGSWDMEHNRHNYLPFWLFWVLIP